MRIVLIGQAAFGEKTLQALLAQGEQVVGVFTPPDDPRRPSPLRLLAEQAGIPVYQPAKMKDPHVYDDLVALAPDLNVMAFVTDIVPDRLLELPPLGTIQYHPSLLPRHRGGSAINWAIIQGETRTGLSIFWPDRGIDTGPVLLQKVVEIGPDDTTGSLYFDKLFPLGVQALAEAVCLVREGRAPRLVQDETLATSEPLCTEARTIIDWTRPAQEIYDLIRGSNPQPGAVTSFGGRKLKLFDSRLLPGVDCPPGEIIALGEDSFQDGIQVSAPGGILLVKRVQVEKEPKISAADFALQAGLKPGDRLGE